MLTIIPKDIKLLLAKCIRSESIKVINNKLEFKNDCHICYDIILNNVDQIDLIEFCLGDIVLYSANNSATNTANNSANNSATNTANKSTHNISIFNKDYPMLLTHIDANKLNFKLYSNNVLLNVTDTANVIIEYTYETIDTHKYAGIWKDIPVTQYINGQFLIYKYPTILFMSITDVYKNKYIIQNNIIVYTDEWLVNVYTDYNLPFVDYYTIKSLYSNVDYSNRNLGYTQFCIKGEANLNSFIETAKLLWKDCMLRQYRIEHKKQSIEYTNIANLILELNQ